MYIGCGLGATCFELQVGRLELRLLRFKYYFKPYRHFLTGKVVFPQMVKFVWYQKES